MCVVRMENFMKTMKLIGISMVGALSLALSGCGGGGGGSNAAPPVNPVNPLNQYVQAGCTAQQTNQPYICPSSGQIQLRNAFGRSQCYATTVLSQACAQAGGILASNGTTCRKERSVFRNLSKTTMVRHISLLRGRFWNSGINRNDYNNEASTFAYSMTIPAQLSCGETLKISGNVDSMNSDVSDWDAELMQNGVVVGSASAGTVMSMDGENNFSITAMAAGVQQNTYQQNYVQNGVYNQGQYPAQYQGNVQYPNTMQYPNSLMQSAGMGSLQSYQLEFRLHSSTRITLDGSAVSCEDGRGNSYPCQ